MVARMLMDPETVSITNCMLIALKTVFGCKFISFLIKTFNWFNSSKTKSSMMNQLTAISRRTLHKFRTLSSRHRSRAV